jgi:glycosyltransferase involved in cell wall biosynthesis
MVFDYDDAIFHNYDMHPNKLIRFLYQNKIKTIIKYASHVITGSPYLTSYVNLHTKRISEIPTSINLSLYDYKLDNILKKKIFVIAWIGSSTTSMNLLNLKDVFVKLFHIDSSIKLKLMGFDKSLVGEFRVPNIEFCDWSPQAELSLLKEMDLGIMPLEDNPFNRGKCGFKLIQYMGMGKPTISSPLPANIKINRDNSNLFAENNHEWFSSILNVRNNPDYFRMIGYRNIAIVEKYYSVETNYNEYVKIFKELQYVRN